MIHVGGGVIDNDYRGEVRVILFNLGSAEFRINKHDRIAQLIIEKYTPSEIVEVYNLPET